jgi:hypothetical protein
LEEDLDSGGGARRGGVARDINLNGGHVGGVDLDGGRAVEEHAEEE